MKIAIVSPQEWQHIAVSKHHYAIEFASRGHEVLFINPPSEAISSTSVDSTQYDRLRTLTYSKPWFYRLRFHARGVYDFLIGRTIRSQLKNVGFQPDVCWCFDFNLYADLNMFGARVNLFHPVDPLSEPSHLAPTKNANLIFTVSNRIAESLGRPDVRVLGHGLSRSFADQARQRLKSLSAAEETPEEKRPIRVGYSGNLMRKPLNRTVVKQVVSQHPNVEFHFWGPFDLDNRESEIGRFIEYLMHAENVVLHGRVEPEELAEALQTVDLFLLVYGLDQAESDRSNSHKLLEYLSTGKATVCSRIDEYIEKPGLLEMPAGGDDDEIPSLFSDAVSQLATLNSNGRAKTRIEFALQHTYEKKADLIESLIQQSLKN